MGKIRNPGYCYFYTGKRVCLRGIEREDYTERMYRWANDPDFNRYLSYGSRPQTARTMEKLFDDLVNKENTIFAIDDKRTRKTIGLVGLHQINWPARSAEYTIHLGEKRFWGKGAAAEATDRILYYAFHTLNLHKVWLGVNEANRRAVAFYKKKGFVTEGKLRDEIFRENSYFDSIRMSMLKNEYEMRYMRK